MGAAIIYYDNIAPDATITATSEASTFEKEYLVDENTANTWRSTDITAQSLVFDFGAATEIEGVCHFNTNMNASVTTWSIQHSANNVTYSDVVALTQAVDSYKEYNYTDRYFKIISDLSAGSYSEIGEIYIFASKYTFSQDIQNESLIQEKQLIETRNQGSLSGHVFRNIHNSRFRMSFEVRGFSDAQKGKFEDIQDSNYVCFLPYGTDSDTVYFGVINFTNVKPIISNDNTPGNLYYDCTVNFVECAY